VAASVFNSGSGATPFRVSISSQLAGASGELLIDGTGLNIAFQETAAAQDALLLVGSLDAATPGALIASTSNEFENVIEGVRLTVNAGTTTPQNITIEKNVDGIISQLKLLVEQYNKLRDKVRDVSSYDLDQNAIGVLFGTSDILQIDMEFSSALTSRYFTTGGIQSFEEVGIGPDAQGKLHFNEDKFRSKYNSNAAGVEQFFTRAGSGGAARLVTAADRLSAKENSTLVNRAGSLQRIIDNTQRQVSSMNATIDRQREQMVKEFARLEQVIGRMQSQMNWIAKIQPVPFIRNSGR
jgi:flagellar hook-associated protein 2